MNQTVKYSVVSPSTANVSAASNVIRLIFVSLFYRFSMTRAIVEITKRFVRNINTLEKGEIQNMFKKKTEKTNRITYFLPFIFVKYYT